jgi:hypothetical protein
MTDAMTPSQELTAEDAALTDVVPDAKVSVRSRKKVAVSEKPKVPPAGGSRRALDNLTEVGASELARRIETYWGDRGFVVSCRIEPVYLGAGSSALRAEPISQRAHLCKLRLPVARPVFLPV